MGTMNRLSVENSTLTLSELTDTRANSGTVVAGTEFNLPLSSDWITRKWHDSPRGIDTLLKVTVTSNVPDVSNPPFSLTPATTYLVQMYDNQAKAEATNLPLFLGGGPGGGSFDGINLQSGFEFTTVGTSTPTAIGHQYPRIVSMTPAPNEDNVPTEIYLELGFSQTMDRPSVENSTLILSKLTATRANDGTVAIEFNLPLNSNWIDLMWHDSPRGEDTLLTVAVTNNVPNSPGSLDPNAFYLVQMYNQAKAEATNLPLILGQGNFQDGSHNVAIDLLSGYEFETGSGSSYPTIVAISHGDSPNLSTKHHALNGSNPNATGVPGAINSSTGAALVLTFSQPMDTATVAASRLTFTELTTAGAAAQAKLEAGNPIQLHLDLDSTLIRKSWSPTVVMEQGSEITLDDTKLTVEVVDAGLTLPAGHTYGVQMSVNQARSKAAGSDLPLILDPFTNDAGDHVVDLLTGR